MGQGIGVVEQQQQSPSGQQPFHSVVQRIAGPSTVSKSQELILDQLTAAEKRQLRVALQDQSKDANKKIKRVLDKAKTQLPSLREASLLQELNNKEIRELKALPPKVALQTEKKIEKIINTKKKASKRLVTKEVTKAKSVCAQWSLNKKDDRTHPVNPESNRKVKKGGATYNLLNKVCGDKKKVCETPLKSPFKGHRVYKDTSRNATIVKAICLPTKKLDDKKKKKKKT